MSDGVVDVSRVVPDVLAERVRIEEVWGPGFPEDLRLAVLMEEVGEVAKELQPPDVTTFGEYPTDRLRRELVQVAAVALRWIEHLDRERAEWEASMLRLVTSMATLPDCSRCGRHEVGDPCPACSDGEQYE